MIMPGLCKIEGFVKITDPVSGDVLVDKKNAIHYENLSIAMAQSLSDRTLAQGAGYIYQMAFGNGGSAVDPTGVITYLPPNTTGQNADLYNVLHTAGNYYTDILVTCLLDYGEPAGQQAFDNSTNFNGEYVFDELGLKCVNTSLTDLRLITHVIFHPVQKSLNRQIQIDYTLRIQTLTNLSAA